MLLVFRFSSSDTGFPRCPKSRHPQSIWRRRARDQVCHRGRFMDRRVVIRKVLWIDSIWARMPCSFPCGVLTLTFNTVV
jgi:hypothetical protein